MTNTVTTMAATSALSSANLSLGTSEVEAQAQARQQAKEILNTDDTDAASTLLKIEVDRLPKLPPEDKFNYKFADKYMEESDTEKQKEKKLQTIKEAYYLLKVNEAVFISIFKQIRKKFRKHENWPNFENISRRSHADMIYLMQRIERGQANMLEIQQISSLKQMMTPYAVSSAILAQKTAEESFGATITGL